MLKLFLSKGGIMEKKWKKIIVKTEGRIVIHFDPKSQSIVSKFYSRENKLVCDSINLLGKGQDYIEKSLNILYKRYWKI